MLSLRYFFLSFFLFWLEPETPSNFCSGSAQKRPAPPHWYMYILYVYSQRATVLVYSLFTYQKIMCKYCRCGSFLFYSDSNPSIIFLQRSIVDKTNMKIVELCHLITWFLYRLTFFKIRIWTKVPSGSEFYLLKYFQKVQYIFFYLKLLGNFLRNNPQ